MMAAAKASSRFMLARGIDVMLQASPALAAPLSLQARADFLVLFTQPGPAGYAISKSRLYDWLMPAYHTKNPVSSLLGQHLPHRDCGQPTAASSMSSGRAPTAGLSS